MASIIKKYSLILLGVGLLVAGTVDAVPPAVFPIHAVPISSPVSPAPTTRAPTFSTAPTLALPTCSTDATCKFNKNTKCSKHCTSEHAGNGMYCGKNILTSDTSQLAEVCCQCDTIKTTKVTLEIALPRCTAGDAFHVLGSNTPICQVPNKGLCQDLCGPHHGTGFFCNGKTGEITTFQQYPCCQCGAYDNIRVVKEVMG
jgi:hypothetical protein